MGQSLLNKRKSQDSFNTEGHISFLGGRYSIPSHLFPFILQYLPFHHLPTLFLTCKNWHHSINSNITWKHYALLLGDVDEQCPSIHDFTLKSYQSGELSKRDPRVQTWRDFVIHRYLYNHFKPICWTSMPDSRRVKVQYLVSIVTHIH